MSIDNNMKKRPIIGVTTDYSTKESYSKFPWYALRENYVSFLTNLGAQVIILPCDIDAVSTYCNITDGLVITGGDFDIDPAYYNESVRGEIRDIIDFRTSFELALFNEYYKLEKPILGICGGEQLINIALGGTLIQHIPDEIANHMIHNAPDAGYRTSHPVNISKDSRLYELCGTDEILVNSSHHQSIKKLGSGLRSAATAPDGVIEAIEDPSHLFCLGVQWHPEFLLTDHDKKITKSFIEACKITS